MAVCQSIFGIGLRSSVRPDSSLSFESECKWWFLEITNIDGLYWLLQAKSAEKRLASALAEKWKREYSEMVFYVRVRMSLGVVKANSLLIRGNRDTENRRRPVITDRAAMYDWRCWHDE